MAIKLELRAWNLLDNISRAAWANRSQNIARAAMRAKPGDTRQLPKKDFGVTVAWVLGTTW